MSRSTPASLLVAFILLGLSPPPALAAGPLAEEFENGLGAWETTGPGWSLDCTRGSPGCSARFATSRVSTYGVLRRAIELSTQGTVVLSYGYMVEGLTGSTDSSVTLLFATGAPFSIHMTAAGSVGNNGIEVRPGGTIAGHHFANIPAANTWYVIEIELNGLAQTAVVRLRAKSGEILATSSPYPLAGNAIRAIEFNGIAWGISSRGLSDRIWYDSIHASYATLVAVPEPPAPMLRFYSIRGGETTECQAFAAVPTACGAFLFASTLAPKASGNGVTLDVSVRLNAEGGALAAGAGYGAHAAAFELVAPSALVGTEVLKLSVDVEGEYGAVPMVTGGCRPTRATVSATTAGGSTIRGMAYAWGGGLGPASPVWLKGGFADAWTGVRKVLVDRDPCRTGDARLPERVIATLPSGLDRLEEFRFGEARGRLDGLPTKIDIEWDASEFGGRTVTQLDLTLPAGAAGGSDGFVDLEGRGRIYVTGIPSAFRTIAVSRDGELESLLVRSSGAPAGGTDVSFSHVDPAIGKRVELEAADVTAIDITLDATTGSIQGDVSFLPATGAADVTVAQHDAWGGWDLDAHLVALTSLSLDVTMQGEDLLIRDVEIASARPDLASLGFHVDGVGTLALRGLPPTATGKIDRDAGALRKIEVTASGPIDEVEWDSEGAGSAGGVETIDATRVTRVLVRLDSLGQAFLDDVRFSPGEGSVDVTLRSRGASDSSGQHKYRTRIWGDGLTRAQGWSQLPSPHIRIAAELAPGHALQAERVDYGAGDMTIGLSLTNRGTTYRAASSIGTWNDLAPGSCTTLSIPVLSPTQARMCAASFV